MTETYQGGGSMDLGMPNKNEMVNVEFWTSDIWPVGLHWGEYYNNTYKAIRLASANYSLYYSVWCTGEREFYDMKTDASQMNNRKSKVDHPCAIHSY